MSNDRDDSSNLSFQRKFYDKRWLGLRHQDRYAQQRLAMLMTLFSIPQIKEPNILDLGAGTGWIAGVLSNFGSVTAVELSEAAVKEAKTRYPHVHFISGSVFDVELERENFDFVISSEVIEHIENQAAYVEIAKHCLKRGGWLVMTTPNQRVREHFSDAEEAMFADQPTENWLNRRELFHLIAEYFEIEFYTTFVLGDGCRGIYRVLNSGKVCSFLRKIALGRVYDGTRRRLGMGLYHAMLASKR